MNLCSAKIESKNTGLITFKKSMHSTLWYAFFLAILTGEKVDINKSINYYLDKIIDNAVNLLPILNIPLKPITDKDCIVISKSNNIQLLKFNSTKFFVICYW